MTTLDIYYRALKEYRKETADNTACEKDRRQIFEANVDRDKLESSKYLCKIQEDWVAAIEEGLGFVEKAVEEQRQFIRTNGEVVPIEKVKRIGKESVEHLAKHSEMITHVPEEEGALLVPDKLYMVEKLSDFAVYENRFLYMMLRYILEFIEYRLEKIETLRRSYFGEFEIDKEIVAGKRTLKIKSSISEKRTDNPFMVPDRATDAVIKRIEDCRDIINSLLNTDLMTQVAKTPMIKPPIVKTNVLKMNNNFKHALALYDYIASYKGDGYTYEEIRYKFTPFTDKVGDELAEALNLVSFLTYKTGNDIEEALETVYNEEETRRKELEIQRNIERIARLKKRAMENEQTLEEYMLALEEHIRHMEKDMEGISGLRREIEFLHREVDNLHAEGREMERVIGELKKEVEAKEHEINVLNQKYIDDMAELKHKHQEEVSGLKNAHQSEVNAIKAKYAEEMNAKISECESKVGAAKSELATLSRKCAETEKDCAKRIAEMEFRVSDFDNATKRMTDEFEQKLRACERECEATVKAAREETVFVRGELDGIRAAQGKLKPSKDYTSRERFQELEEEYEAFQKFFKAQWEYTKKEIRKTILWSKEEKANGKNRK